MRAPSATTKIGGGRQLSFKAETLFLRSVASRERDAFRRGARLERLRMHLEPTGLAAGERQQIAQLRVQQHRRAAHAPDQLVIFGNPVAMPHLEDIERRDDALQRRAQLVADLGEEGASSAYDVVHRLQSGALLLDLPDAVHAMMLATKKSGIKPSVTAKVSDSSRWERQ